MMRRLLLWACCAGLMAGGATSVRAQSAEERPSESSLRAAARRILAESEFRYFEHLDQPQSPRSQSAAEPSSHRPQDASSNERSDGTAPTDGEQQPQQQPWWKRAKKSTARDGGGGSSSQSNRSPDEATRSRRSATAGPSSRQENGANGGERAAQGGEPQPGDGARSGPRGSEASSSTPPSASPDASQSDRPSRASRPGAPSQRAVDGVERPVRYAPRTSAGGRQSGDTSRGWFGRSGRSDSGKDGGSSGGSGGQGAASLFSGLGMLVGSLFTGVAWLALAAVCVLIVVLVARALAEHWARRPEQLPPEAVGAPLAHDRAPGEVAADVYLQQALALAQRHEYREAIGQLLLGGMSCIERQDWIRYRRGLTLRDYLRSLRGRPPQFTGFQTMVAVYEPVEFGRRPATQSLFESALDSYRQAFPPELGGAPAA